MCGAGCLASLLPHAALAATRNTKPAEEKAVMCCVVGCLCGLSLWVGVVSCCRGLSLWDVLYIKQHHQEGWKNITASKNEFSSRMKGRKDKQTDRRTGEGTGRQTNGETNTVTH